MLTVSDFCFFISDVRLPSTFLHNHSELHSNLAAARAIAAEDKVELLVVRIFGME